ncbi:enediyne antibiotic chromoprotein [Streptomyces diastatochromogenes]|nr:enediyne antibiotic chromoprotein [Streptomyces diastatochromogenes]
MIVKNKLARVVAVSAAAAGLALALQTSASAATTVSVSPATGLANNQQVAVTASGLTPNTVFHIGQCAQVAPGKYGCDKTTAVDVTSDANGNINSSLVVHSSYQAVVDASGNIWGTVDAKATQTFVSVMNDLGTGGFQNISFK